MVKHGRPSNEESPGSHVVHVQTGGQVMNIINLSCGRDDPKTIVKMFKRSEEVLECIVEVLDNSKFQIDVPVSIVS